jgi:hypothetical protein
MNVSLDILNEIADATGTRLEIKYVEKVKKKKARRSSFFSTKF